MYNGEVNIYQKELDKFLYIAQRFKLEGLIGNVEKNPIGQVKPDFKIEEAYSHENTLYVKNSDDIDKINDKIEE